MSAEIIDLPITNAKQVAMTLADGIPDTPTRAAIWLAVFDAFPVDYQTEIRKRLADG